MQSPQNFNRINLIGKYNTRLSNKNNIGFTISHFSSSWDASGQIPERAVTSGLIDRFGAIDDTEGGSTSRTNFLIDYKNTLDDRSWIESQVFLSRYDFELFSNFTFYLEDSVNGDQIKQFENRMMYGLNSEYQRLISSDQFNGVWKIGVNLRNDQTYNSELSHTLNRKETLEQLQLGDINETNLSGYSSLTLNFNKFTIKPAFRLDIFEFQYYDKLLSAYSTQSNSELIASPKLNLSYNTSERLQLYFKLGKGFHTNDSRLAVASSRKSIPSAYGADLGFIWKPNNNMMLSTAYWYLFLEQEFVYVGDASIVEPSDRSKRHGAELSYRYQPLPWLYWNVDANYTFARFDNSQTDEQYIPLAPNFTLVNSLSLKHELGVYGNLSTRFLANRPANEDYSIVAEDYTVTDLSIGYSFNGFDLAIHVQNLFDTDWNETHFATESRLQNETEAVEEIHFTPGTPLFAKVALAYSF